MSDADATLRERDKGHKTAAEEAGRDDGPTESRRGHVLVLSAKSYHDVYMLHKHRSEQLAQLQRRDISSSYVIITTIIGLINAAQREPIEYVVIEAHVSST